VSSRLIGSIGPGWVWRWSWVLAPASCIRSLAWTSFPMVRPPSLCLLPQRPTSLVWPHASCRGPADVPRPFLISFSFSFMDCGDLDPGPCLLLVIRTFCHIHWMCWNSVHSGHMTSIASVHPGEGSSSVALLEGSSLVSLWKGSFYFGGLFSRLNSHIHSVRTEEKQTVNTANILFSKTLGFQVRAVTGKKKEAKSIQLDCVNGKKEKNEQLWFRISPRKYPIKTRWFFAPFKHSIFKPRCQTQPLHQRSESPKQIHSHYTVQLLLIL